MTSANPVVIALICSMTLAGAAKAQAPGLTTTLSAATDYHSKGISKSLDDGSVSIATDWASEDSLFYAGTSATTVDLAIGATYEADVKVGLRPKVLGWTLDFAVFYRAFPDANAGADDDYVEARAQASRAWGPVSLRLLSWQTPDNFGPAEAANWSEAKLSMRFAPAVTGSLAFGHHDQDLAPTYSAWNAGVVVGVAPNVSFDLRWYDTNGHEFGPRFDGEAIASLTYKLGG